MRVSALLNSVPMSESRKEVDYHTDQHRYMLLNFLTEFLYTEYDFQHEMMIYSRAKICTCEVKYL